MSRRRLDDAGFDPAETDEDGLPLVYNEERCGGGAEEEEQGRAAVCSPAIRCTGNTEQRPPSSWPPCSIADYWKDRPGELTSRWTKFAGISVPVRRGSFTSLQDWVAACSSSSSDCLSTPSPGTHSCRRTPSVASAPASPLQWLTKLANGFIQGKLQDAGTQVQREAGSALFLGCYCSHLPASPAASSHALCARRRRRGAADSKFNGPPARLRSLPDDRPRWRGMPWTTWSASGPPSSRSARS